MRTLRVLPVVFLLAAAAGGGGCGTSDAGFKLIHVDHLVAMLGSNEGAVTLLDANGSDFRTKEGVTPALSSCRATRRTTSKGSCRLAWTLGSSSSASSPTETPRM